MGAVETLAYLFLILSILFYIKTRVNKTTVVADNFMLEANLNDYLKEFKEGAVLIIFLHYDSSVYGEIDALVSKENDRCIVIFRGPDWLIKLKKQMWKQHVVIDENELPFLTQYEGIVRRTKTGKLQYFSNQREYLEYHRAKSTFLARLENSF